MIKFNVIAVGKIKEKYFSDAVAEYVKRISRFGEIAVGEVAEALPNKTVAERCAVEGNELLKKAKGFIIALDGRGKEMGSRDFADFISQKCTAGISQFDFIIGGSDGLSEDARKGADFVMSFSKMTFPHQLFRVMLLEQIYRAITILNNVPYHK